MGWNQVATTEMVHTLIHRQIEKQEAKKGQLFLPHRNFILPSYHCKTHFKGGTAMQLQTDPSLQLNDLRLRR